MRIGIALMVGILTSSVVIASLEEIEEIEECSVVKVNQISYDLVYALPQYKSVSDVYKEQLKKLISFSEENKLQQFKITSENLSVEPILDIPDTSKVSISFSFESQFDEVLIDKIRFSLSPKNLTFTVQDQKVCFTY